MTQRTPGHPLWTEPDVPGAGHTGTVGFLPFLAIALLLHLAVLGVTAPGSSSAGGVGGEAAISLQGATPAISAMVAEWERPPTVTPPPETESMEPAQPDTLPPLPDVPSDRPALAELLALPAVTEPPAVPLSASDAPAVLPRLGTPATELPAPPADAPGLPTPADAAPAATPRLTALPQPAASRSPMPDSTAPLPTLPMPTLAMPTAPALPGEPPTERAASEPRLPTAPLPRLSGLAPLQAPAPTTERPAAAQATAPAAVDSTPPPPAGALDGRAQQLAPERSRVPEPRPAQRAAQPPAPSRNAQSARPAAPSRQTVPAQAPAQAATPPAQTAAPTAPAARAAGSGAAPRDGASGRAAATSRAGGDSAALVAQWGGAIRAAVQRQQRHPHGVRSGGTVHLQLAVNANGQLASVQMTQSSGHAALDRAAMDAVRRARLPSAPQGLSGTYRFNLPVRFRG
ncbi:MAG: TonB family protein [Pararhodobacter sp.]